MILGVDEVQGAPTDQPIGVPAKHPLHGLVARKDHGQVALFHDPVARAQRIVGLGLPRHHIRESEHEAQVHPVRSSDVHEVHHRLEPGVGRRMHPYASGTDGARNLPTVDHVSHLVGDHKLERRRHTFDHNMST